MNSYHDAVTGRMEGAEEILSKINNTIDERITVKVPKNLESTVEYMERPDVKDMFTKLIDARIEEKVKTDNPPQPTSPKSFMENDQVKKLFSYPTLKNNF